ncbi:unnamed protein product [Gemmata massiliana]|uniref:Uncharacterized protein n=1 Tax=Gemmata massiliana TaxID=1210884 RepID=A0A6P2CYF7_9BACT|nr:unnamed protein product [Gemmata massiliana]
MSSFTYRCLRDNNHSYLSVLPLRRGEGQEHCTGCQRQVPQVQEQFHDRSGRRPPGLGRENQRGCGRDLRTIGREAEAETARGRRDPRDGRPTRRDRAVARSARRAEPTISPHDEAGPGPSPDVDEPDAATDTSFLLALGALTLVGPTVLASQLPFGRLIALAVAAIGLVGGLLCLGAEGRARVGGALAARCTRALRWLCCCSRRGSTWTRGKPRQSRNHKARSWSSMGAASRR